MSDQPTQPGQRNIASHGNDNINVSGDHNTFNFYQTPPLPPPSPLHQLRAPVGDFVGRAKEIADLVAALKHNGESNAAGISGISGISGLGGIGKTELAYVVAAHLAPQYPDAQLVVDLRGTDAVPRAAAEALAECVRAFAGLEVRLPDDEAALVRLYRECLTGRRALVVLDNAASDEQVRPFLPPPGSALLVTSRATLHLPGLCARIQLDELAPAEARTLLQEMVPRIADTVADQICSLCGYLPLAVRAAGGLLDVTPDLDPAEYAEELRDTRARLALRYTNAEGRNISVEASFQLSYQRLPEGAARVLRALAVFPADFDGAAVEAIAADAGRLQLRELLRRNLVRYRTEEQRYRLHDLARVFADAQLSDNERDSLKLRHAEYYVDVVEAANDWYKERRTKFQHIGWQIASLEWANIKAGQKWASALANQDKRAAELCIAFSKLQYLPSEPHEIIFWEETAVTAAQLLNQREEEKDALLKLGNVYAGLEETHIAIKFYERVLRIASDIGDRKGEGNALWKISLSLKKLGDRAQSFVYANAALKIFEEIEDFNAERVRAQLAEWRQ